MFQRFISLPYAEFWIPAVVGLGVIGVLYYLLRPNRRLAAVAGTQPEGLADTLVKAPAAKEQRRSFRREGNPIPVKYARPECKENPQEGWVVDRSMGGFCLMTHEQVPDGTILAVLPTKAVEMVPWVEVEVRSCRFGEDCYEVGCQFVKPPPYSIMLLFG